MSYIVFGASSGLGKDLCYELAKNKKKITIVSRDKRDLINLQNNIKTIFKTSVKFLVFDFSRNIKISSIKNKFKKIKNIEGILFPVGFAYENDELETLKNDIDKILNVNLINIIKIILFFTKIFNKQKHGSITGFGSISSVRGRSKNIIYSLSKRGLQSFFESLYYNFSNTKIFVQFYTLGYLNTNQSYNIKSSIIPKGDTRKLSKIVFNNFNKNIIEYYFPNFWKYICILIRNTPFKIFRFLILKK
jgi:short-subunit dehydrogenase